MALGYVYDVQIAAVVKSYHNRIYQSNFSQALRVDLLKGNDLLLHVHIEWMIELLHTCC